MISSQVRNNEFPIESAWIRWNTPVNQLLYNGLTVEFQLFLGSESLNEHKKDSAGKAYVGVGESVLQNDNRAEWEAL